MKKIIFIALLLFTVHCSLLTATAQSRTNRLTRPCPGSTTPATVSISVAGNITLTPCSGGTVTVNGVKVYRALLTQSGTSAPTAVVLENTLGTVVWTYLGVGEYLATLSGAFPLSKTAISAVPTDWNNQIGTQLIRNDADTLTLYTFDLSSLPAISPLNSALVSVKIEILVYP